MNKPLRETFARRMDEAELNDLDTDALVGLGESRLRRRRLAATLGSAGAVIVLVAALVVSRTNTSEHGTGPVDHPSPGQSVRALVYSDVLRLNTGNGLRGRTVQVGDRVVRTGNGFVHMDMTDDGVVYTSADSVWFTDGGVTTPIGSHPCSYDTHLWVGPRVAVSANVGSLVAWFDCSQPARPSLVVFDTASKLETVRRPMPSCSLVGGWCLFDAVIGDHIYFSSGSTRSAAHAMFDVTTGRTSTATHQSYAEDVRSHPRGLVIGDSAQSGEPTSGIGLAFHVDGSRLVARAPANGPSQSPGIFDTTTGHPVEFRLPGGYDVRGAADLALFQWLDDDTVALMVGGGRWPGGPHYGDILTCRLSSGRCVLAVSAPRIPRIVRIVPNITLPEDYRPPGI
ncbi:MAG: hypothetical protein ABIQ59_12970 [Nocardioidaceae bacterium]